MKTSNGKRRFAFSKDRAEAIKSLRMHLQIEFDMLSEAECDVLVARVFANVKETTPITFRARLSPSGVRTSTTTTISTRSTTGCITSRFAPSTS
jgi:hypothetical protein